MPSLEEVHGRLRVKAREKSELQKAFKDELANNPRYQQIAEQLKVLKEEKKSIENQVWAASSADAQKLDLLALDIKSDREMLSELALNMYVKGETVQIVDEFQARWVPKFAVTFKKDDEMQEERSSAAAEVPEPDFAA
ncbi:MAG: hypothetical protein QY323_00555 [Patescibacteria group bacterium]|nr:MAG: hypothetical protein QY323_00555 [Patescibacteria group bacterium]